MTVIPRAKALKRLLAEQYEFVTDLLYTYNVPENNDELDVDSYLLTNDKTVAKAKATNTASLDELQERLNTIKNKMRQKKTPTTERAKQRRESKKLKKNKEFKKVLVSAAKSIKNENAKQLKTEPTESEDSKAQIKPVKQKAIFNSEGKIVYSKFDFAAHPGAKPKKSHQNPREILKKIKETDRKLNELKEQGETEKAAEIKNDLAWQKAFDKVEGKKVKDDPKLLYKAIKKRKDEKKKSKTKWTERKQKVEADKDKRQKKRQENLDKRSKDKKNKKLKKASKKGRVIPGF